MSEVANAPAPTPAPPAPAPAPTPSPTPSPSPSPAPAPTPAPAPSPTPAPAPAEPDWRDSVIGKLADNATDDQRAEFEATRKMLERVKSLPDLAKITRDLQKKVSAGLKSQLPKNATEAQLKEWRAENGIPESPDKYELKLGDGVVLGEDDKASVGEFLKTMHGVNASPDVVSAAVKWDLARQEQEIVEIQRVNDTAAKEVRVALTEKWGAKDFQDNADAIQSMLSAAGQDVLDLFKSARGPDDVALLNNPAVIEGLAGFARELGYVGATVVPGGGNVVQSLEAERDAISKVMETDPDKYYADTKMQARLGVVLESLGRQQKKAQR